MGYWQIPENAKRPLAHYATLLPATLAMLAGQRLVFLSDSVVVQRWVEAVARASGVQMIAVSKSIDALPAREFTAHFLRQTERYGAGTAVPAQFNQEKGLWHYWRDFRASGSAVYQKLLAIWLSKVLLMEEFARSDPFGSEYFAWVDATAARFNGRRLNCNFVGAAGRDGMIAHYRSAMRKYNRALSLNASFLKGDRRAWERLTALYREQLQFAAIQEPYPNDEETLLHEIIRAHPDLFWVLDPDEHAPDEQAATELRDRP
jgi:hypothetical protein